LTAGRRSASANDPVPIDRTKVRFRPKAVIQRWQGFCAESVIVFPELEWAVMSLSGLAAVDGFVSGAVVSFGAESGFSCLPRFG